jgi:hypothetical protein
MANGLYVAFRNGILGAHATRVDLDADTIRVAFVDTGTYTVNLTTHDFYNDLTGVWPNTRATGVALASPTIGTVAAGVFDANDSVFTAFSNGSVSVEAIVLYKDSGTDATSNLIAWWDTGVTGMPFTPSGGDVTIAWNASGILSD